MSLRDTIRRLMPGITEEHLSRAVAALSPFRVVSVPWVDDLAQAESSPSATGTSSVGGHGQPPAAPSTPTPQANDMWEDADDGEQVRLIHPHRDRHDRDWWVCWVEAQSDDANGRPGSKVSRRMGRPHAWRLIERDGHPWPPAQEPEPGEDCGQNVEAERPEPDDPSQEPATDEDITRWEAEGTAHVSVDRLIARLRQEQDRNDQYRVDVDQSRRERDEAVTRVEQAEARTPDSAMVDGDGWKALADLRHHSLREQRARAERAERERDEYQARAIDAERDRDEAEERARAAEDFWAMKVGAVRERGEHAEARAKAENERADDNRERAERAERERDRARNGAETFAQKAGEERRARLKAEAQAARMRPVVEAADAAYDRDGYTGAEGIAHLWRTIRDHRAAEKEAGS